MLLLEYIVGGDVLVSDAEDVGGTTGEGGLVEEERGGK